MVLAYSWFVLVVHFLKMFYVVFWKKKMKDKFKAYVVADESEFPAFLTVSCPSYSPSQNQHSQHSFPAVLEEWPIFEILYVSLMVDGYPEVCSKKHTTVLTRARLSERCYMF